MAQVTKSSMVRFLKGKVIPGQPSAVVDIAVKGNLRLVTLKNGHILRKSKADMLEAFQTVLSAEQKLKAKKSLRVAPDGTTSATIGGTEKGSRKTYKTKAGALKAINRHYGA